MNPLTKEEAQFTVDNIREDIKQLDRSRVRLLELSRSWWLRKSHNDLLHGAAALAIRAATKWRDLNDAIFQLEVLTKGRVEASVNRAVRVLSEQVVGAVYAPCGLCGDSKVVRVKGYDERIRSWPCDECKPAFISFAKALENAEKTKYQEDQAARPAPVYPVNPNTDTQPY